MYSIVVHVVPSKRTMALFSLRSSDYTCHNINRTTWSMSPSEKPHSIWGPKASPGFIFSRPRKCQHFDSNHVDLDQPLRAVREVTHRSCMPRSQRVPGWKSWGIRGYETSRAIRTVNHRVVHPCNRHLSHPFNPWGIFFFRGSKGQVFKLAIFARF